MPNFFFDFPPQLYPQPDPFHDITNGRFNWVLELESHAETIRNEFLSYMQQTQGGTWLGARNTDGVAYGPEWKTLGLQDRGLWDEDNVRMFPQTCKILTELKVPACEAFFARQVSCCVVLLWY